MRYEIRVYYLEEFLPENRMTYSPCDGQDDAKLKYADMLETYADNLHIVNLCQVTYTPYGETVKVLASSDSDNPNHIIWDDEWL